MAEERQQPPAPWTIMEDENGDQFYWNEETGESTWEFPVEENLETLKNLENIETEAEREFAPQDDPIEIVDDGPIHGGPLSAGEEESPLKDRDGFANGDVGADAGEEPSGVGCPLIELCYTEARVVSRSNDRTESRVQVDVLSDGAGLGTGLEVVAEGMHAGLTCAPDLLFVISSVDVQKATSEEEECLPTVDLLPVYGAGSTPKDLNEIVGGDEGDGLLFVFLAGHELEEAVFATIHALTRILRKDQSKAKSKQRLWISVSEVLQKGVELFAELFTGLSEEDLENALEDSRILEFRRTDAKTSEVSSRINASPLEKSAMHCFNALKFKVQSQPKPERPWDLFAEELDRFLGPRDEDLDRRCLEQSPSFEVTFSENKGQYIVKLKQDMWRPPEISSSTAKPSAKESKPSKTAETPYKEVKQRETPGIPKKETLRDMYKNVPPSRDGRPDVRRRSRDEVRRRSRDRRSRDRGDRHANGGVKLREARNVQEPASRATREERLRLIRERHREMRERHRKEVDRRAHGRRSRRRSPPRGSRRSPPRRRTPPRGSRRSPPRRRSLPPRSPPPRGSRRSPPPLRPRSRSLRRRSRSLRRGAPPPRSPPPRGSRRSPPRGRREPERREPERRDLERKDPERRDPERRDPERRGPERRDNERRNSGVDIEDRLERLLNKAKEPSTRSGSHLMETLAAKPKQPPASPDNKAANEENAWPWGKPGKEGGRDWDSGTGTRSNADSWEKDRGRDWDSGTATGSNADSWEKNKGSWNANSGKDRGNAGSSSWDKSNQDRWERKEASERSYYRADTQAPEGKDSWEKDRGGWNDNSGKDRGNGGSSSWDWDRETKSNQDRWERKEASEHPYGEYYRADKQTPEGAAQRPKPSSKSAAPSAPRPGAAPSKAAPSKAPSKAASLGGKVGSARPTPRPPPGPVPPWASRQPPVPQGSGGAQPSKAYPPPPSKANSAAGPRAMGSIAARQRIG